MEIFDSGRRLRPYNKHSMQSVIYQHADVPRLFLWYMKKIILLTLLSVLVFPAVVNHASKKGDPVVMTVGKSQVRLSEFEYLYKKNNAQQQSDLTLDQYIDMFVKYKMKVEAARAAGLDTVSSYRADMDRYGRELAAPYLYDREMRDSLVEVAYSHICEVVTLHHLLLPAKTDSRDEMAQKAFADSLHRALLAGADFKDMILKYSADRGAASTGGRMHITGGLLPYAFEDVVYQTEVGHYSPVFKTIFGLHIVYVDSRQPNPGEVKTRHILKLTRGKSPEEIAVQKHVIDSIHSLLVAGGDFKQIASAETDDPSGKGNGGDLPWFGPGRMVEPFETAAFSLAPGQISQPVETAFGYHIILCEGVRRTMPVDSVRGNIEMMIERDQRYGMIHRRAIDKYAGKRGVKFNKKTASEAERIILSCSGLDDAKERLGKISKPAFSIGKKDCEMAEVARKMGGTSQGDVLKAYKEALDACYVEAVAADMIATLPDREPDYRNLYNEYSDGMLLYEISNREVWDKANTDKEGLEEYFRSHRQDFRWDAPHYRGFIISAESDSLAGAALNHLSSFEQLSSFNADDDVYKTELRKKFGNKVKIERVNAAKGDYAIVDYVAFGGPAPAADKRWQGFRGYKGDIADQPETAMDVRGQVSMAYQQQLEDQWVGRLAATYKVTIDRNALLQLK